MATGGQRTAWHNHLPQRLLADDCFERLTGKQRLVLQSIADRCDRLADGSLVGALGGNALIRDAGCVRSTFWRAVKALERFGFLVCLSRGGSIRVRSRQGVFNAANCYGIPAHRGALDGRRVRRQVVQMLIDEHGARCRQVVEEGEQATLWPRETVTQTRNDRAHARDGTSSPGDHSLGASTRLDHSSAGPTCGDQSYAGPKSDYPRPKIGLPPSENRTLPSHRYHPRRENPMSEHGVCAEPILIKTPRAWLKGVTANELADTTRLLDRYFEAVSLGLVESNDHHRLQFVTAAQCALRVGKNPGAVFAVMVSRRAWHQASDADEDRAQRRLVDHARKVECA